MAPAPALRHALLAGGGSGGHVFPALALADELRRRGWQVSFTGRAAGLEERLTREREIPFHELPARPFLGRGLTAKLGALATLARSAWSASRLVRRLGADVVVGTGGYVSAPAVVGARLARRPVLLVEPNAHPGVANRSLSRLATEAATGYAEAAAYLSCPSTTTGVPVRAVFFAVSPELPPEDERLQLLVLGGSQGARQVNELVAGAAPELLARFPTLAIVHQAGPDHVAAARALYEAAGADPARITVTPFLDDVAGAMAASHLLVSRAGAITLAEICAAGRPSVLIPLSIAEAHQVSNARALAAAGAAELVTPDEAKAATAVSGLTARLAALLEDRGRRTDMAHAARALARPGAAAAMADRLAALAAGARPGGRG